MNNTLHVRGTHTENQNRGLKYLGLMLSAVIVAGCSSNSTPADISSGTDTTEPGTPSPAQGPISGNINTEIACTGSSTDVQSAMLQLVNEFRASPQNCGNAAFPAATALVWNTQLETAANRHSDDMSTQNFFSHTSSDGLSVSDRVTAAGYNWSRVGENIAGGQPNTDSATQAWISSVGHCENLMNEKFTDIAVSCRTETGSNLTHYWTMVLATPR